jgi:hypothetical protein
MFSKSKIIRLGLSMLGKLVCAAVVLVLVPGIGLATEDGGGAKHTRVGKITKIDIDNGTMTVKIMRQDSSSGNLICTLTLGTKFKVSNGRGKGPTAVTRKDEIKAKFKVGVKIRLLLAPNNKTAREVTLVQKGAISAQDDWLSSE